MLFVLAIGFGLSLVAPLLHRLLGRALPFVVAGAVAGMAMWLTMQLSGLARGGAQSVSYDWFPAMGVGLSLRLDGLSLLFSLLITAIGALIVLYAGGYLAHEPGLGRFYAYMLAFMASMLGTVLADDLILLFVFWELTSLTSYLLIGFNQEQKAARAAALQALLVTGGGGLAMLAGFVLLGEAAGEYRISSLITRAPELAASPVLIPALWLILTGAFTKSAQAPFHFWLPAAMEAPTPVSAYLHSSTMVKAGVFLLARLHPLFSDTTTWTIAVPVVGGVTMVVGALQALMQTDLKKVLAYSTISTLGALTLLLGLGSPEAATAAMVLLLAHALYKAPLFLAAGSIDHATGTRDLRNLGGLLRVMPLTALVVLLAAASNAGLPPLLSFIAKELSYEAVQHAAWPALVSGAAVLANMFLAATAIVLVVDPFLRPRPQDLRRETTDVRCEASDRSGEKPRFIHGGRDAPPDVSRLTSHVSHPHEASPVMWLPGLALALAGLGLGLRPAWAQRVATPAAAATLGRVHDFHLDLWNGFNFVLLLSAMTVAGGVILYLQRGRMRSIPQRLGRLEPITPSGLYRLTLDGILKLAEAQTRLLQNGYLRVYLMIVIATTLLLVGASWALRPCPIGESRPVPRIHEWAIAALLAGALVMALLSRSRLAAVAALGGVGFSVAIFFALLGGPDLAMTQFAVETLTVVLLIFVLYRMPRFATFTWWPQRLAELLVAAAAGATMAWLLLVATAGASQDTLRRYFIDNSLPAGKGRNIVNVILVDFRAFDTLGEITVLAVAAIGVLALLRLRPEDAR